MKGSTVKMRKLSHIYPLIGRLRFQKYQVNIIGYALNFCGVTFKALY